MPNPLGKGKIHKTSPSPARFSGTQVTDLGSGFISGIFDKKYVKWPKWLPVWPEMSAIINAKVVLKKGDLLNNQNFILNIKYIDFWSRACLIMAQILPILKSSLRKSILGLA